MKNYIMSLDQGTTSSRCIIFDKVGNVIGSAQKELTQIYPEQGWVEHNPEEILESQLQTAKEALSRAGLTAADIDSIGITNQRETTVLWDKNTGKPVHNAIVWQCRRTAEYCDELKASGFSQIIREKTGLITDAYFSATKVKWILENTETESENLLFGTIDTWLIWNLTGGKIHATDYTNASRTMLFNIHTLEWDDEILKELNIPRSILPEVKPSSCVYGYTAIEHFGGEIPIAGVAGDQHAALFGQCCFEPGAVKNTYGTGCFILINTGENAITSEGGLLTTIAYVAGGEITYALEGSVFSAGSAVQWLRDGLNMLDDAAESENYANSVIDNGGVYFVPAFTGLGAPYWDSYARGAFFGITRGARKAHLIRAVLESIAYQCHDVINKSGIALKEIKVDGGASANDFLMQFQADILNAKVIRPANLKSTALGAAYLAGLATGFYESKDDIIKHAGFKTNKVFIPNMGDETRAKLLGKWQKAVLRTLDWEEKHESNSD
jgi:glycerol kinase